jgi:hypothetical protein
MSNTINDITALRVGDEVGVFILAANSHCFSTIMLGTVTRVLKTQVEVEYTASKVKHTIKFDRYCREIRCDGFRAKYLVSREAYWQNLPAMKKGWLKLRLEKELAELSKGDICTSDAVARLRMIAQEIESRLMVDDVPDRVKV